MAITRVSSFDYIDLTESMSNGGGPACLRLRVVLTESELAEVHPGVFLNTEKFKELKAWINRHYRETLEPKDLGDIHILEENRAGLAELTDILQLGPVYSFQEQT